MLPTNLEMPGAGHCLFMAPVPVAVWSYPERTKLHTQRAQGSLVTTLSRFLGLSKVPRLDLSCPLYFKKLAAEPHQAYCVLSFWEGHGPVLLLSTLIPQPTQPFPTLSQPLVNLPHLSRLGSSVRFPCKDFSGSPKWNEEELTWWGGKSVGFPMSQTWVGILDLPRGLSPVVPSFNSPIHSMSVMTAASRNSFEN